jgi:queuine tRNA-ribosyltransferase
MTSALNFHIAVRDAGSAARVGRVETRHGSFDTPAFMPVGTQGTIKGIVPSLVAQTGAQIILGNTYHLMLRPGSPLVASLAGLHAFMNWPGPILTDSGGYQAYSMSDLTKLSDDGVSFRSVVDGSLVHLSPERAIEIQNELGADIIMALDDCPPSADPATLNQSRLRIQASRTRASKNYDHAKRLDEANERTIRWLERCKAAHARPGVQSLFGIVQGGTDLERRTRSADQVCGVDLPGYAIGGVAVGEGFPEIVKVVRHTAPLLPDSKPRYLMGVGYERDIVAAVRAGVDMFDCVLPTRNGRNAFAFTPTGPIRLRNAQHAGDARPIDDSCDCYACRPDLNGWRTGGAPPGAAGSFSRAYLRHLFMAKEMLGPILVSLHNLRHFQRLMLDIRRAIRDNDWLAFGRCWPVAAEGWSDGEGNAPDAEAD